MRMSKSIIFILVVGVLVSCTTQKKRNDLSLIGKIYQNTTARYNGYFNANELMLETYESINQGHQDNYNKLLPIYTYSELSNPQMYAENLDKAIEKVTVVINLHRPSHWVDDCYLLMGQAQFIKQDYEGAEQTFRYLIEEYPPEIFDNKKKDDRAESKEERALERTKAQVKKDKIKDIKERKKLAKKRSKARKKYNQQVRKNRKRKKQGKKTKTLKNPNSNDKDSKKVKKDSTQNKLVEKEELLEIEEESDSIIGLISIFNNDDYAGGGEEDPDNYFLKHRPAYQEGLFWLAKSMIARDQYDAAERFLNRLDKDPATFDEIRQEIPVLWAYYFIRKEQYSEAIAPLEDAVKVTKDREKKARYAFILAQLHEMGGDLDKAFASFKEVAKLTNNYEMEFSARLNVVQSEWETGLVAEEETKKRLGRMLKDLKNIDYKDRIYFTLASIALKSGDKPEAVKNLELALKNGSQNKTQKAESYYQLAKLYFEGEDYVAAKLYYDSTKQVLPKTDERYNEVSIYSKKLVAIAKHLQQIELQDSLLRISELSEEDKKKLAFEIKKKQDEEKRAALAAAANRSSSRSNTVRAASPSALNKESSWFAYDDKAVKRGQKDFQRKWGSRLLEDNWRLSEKGAAAEFDDIGKSEEIANTVLTDEDVAQILKDVPKDKKEKELARIKIKKAMFELGKAYRNDLERNDKAAEVLEKLDNTYSGNSFELDSWYYLYLVHNDMGNVAKQDIYKNKILGKFPSSNYAQLIQNPNYLAELQDEEKKLNSFYNVIYADFKDDKYEIAFEKIKTVSDKFGPTNILQPRFALLSAMCVGRIKGKEAYLDALKEVVARYPNTDEQKRAREIMRLLGAGGPSLPGGATADTNEKFKMEEGKSHYILVAFSGDVKTNDKKRNISDYNRKYHKLQKLGLTAMFLNSSNSDNRQPLIVIRRFKNKEEAMKYFDGIQANLSEFMPDDEGVPYEIFAVSLNNYRQILRSRSLDGYKAFFDANYQD